VFSGITKTCLERKGIGAKEKKSVKNGRIKCDVYKGKGYNEIS
jgi:hypothetical protein